MPIKKKEPPPSKLKEARLAAKYTRKRLCEELKMPYRTLENYENGTREMPPWVETLLLEKIERMAKK